MWLIGDVHGQWFKLKKILENCDEAIQLGDLGIGFPERIRKFDFDSDSWKTMYDFSNFTYNVDKFKFIRGNHDSPFKCKRHQNYLGDFGVYKDIFFISGAWSIDKDVRTPGYDWWSDEELTIVDFYKALELYTKVKPDIVISHDCPQRVLYLLHSYPIPTRTGQGLEAMLSEHAPKEWYFAHHHMSFERTVGQTKFKCLNELEVVCI